MRAFHRARPGRQSLFVQVTPLIDMVFLLLCYFLFTFSFRPVEGILPSELGLAKERRAQAERQPKRQAVVRVIETGSSVSYFLDEWPVASLGELGELLARLPESTLMVIDAQPVVRYRHVVDLYNFLLARRFRNVIFPVTAA